MRSTSVTLVWTILLATHVVSTGFAIDWHVFRGDRRHSGYTPNDAPFDSLLAWSYANRDSIVYSSPVLAEDGTIYVGTVGEQLLAFSPLGDPLWTFTASGNFRHSSPAVAGDGTIHIGDSGGRLYAVWPDGSERWTYSTGSEIKTSPNILADGGIVFGATDGQLYVVNANGTLRWTYPTGAEIRSSPAIGPDGTIFFGSSDNYFYALWPDGNLRWRALTGDIIKFCSPAVSESGVVYFGSYDGLVYAVTSDQQFLWAYPTGNVVRSSPAIGPNGRVYIGSSDKLLALDAGDGSLVWDYDANGEVTSSPVYFGDDDVVCVGSEDGVFHAVDALDGGGQWTYTVGNPIVASPAPGLYGLVYAADVRGKLWAFGDTSSVVGVEDVATSAPPMDLLVAPNPAQGNVSFQVLGVQGEPAAIRIFDLRGRVIARLETDAAGRVVWDGRGTGDRRVGSGVYHYRVDGTSISGRVVLAR